MKPRFCALRSADAADVGEACGRRVARAVVDDDDFERNFARVFAERTQAGERVFDLVVDRDHDRHARRGAGRHGERRRVVDRCRVGFRGESRRRRAPFLRDARDRSAQAALREAAARACRDRAQVIGAERERGAQRAQARLGGTQRPRDAPGQRSEHFFVQAFQLFEARL
jgi:hypothetical protein